MGALVKSSEKDFAIRRQTYRSKIIYVDQHGERIRSQQLLDRINGLVIPPNWHDVRVCSKDHGHIQAIGYDDRNRKQYIYHPRWQKQQHRKKFRNLIHFAQALPHIRRRAYRDLERKRWNKQKTLGLVVLTLDEVYIRIGNRRYMEENGTFGLTTLRRKHYKIDDQGITFQYKGKRNKYRKVSLKKYQLSRLIKKCVELPGYEIFRYQNQKKWYSLNSSDVNHYLSSISPFECTAKDFRTWGGTRLAVELFPEALKEIQKHPRRKVSTTLVRKVAKRLGNTVTICREHYIHPRILELLESGEYQKLEYKNHRGGKYALSAAEKKALALISE